MKYGPPINDGLTIGNETQSDIDKELEVEARPEVETQAEVETRPGVETRHEDNLHSQWAERK